MTMTDYNISDAELPTMVVRCDNTLVLRSIITGQHLSVLGKAPSWVDPPLPTALRLQREQVEREYNTALEAFVNLLPLAEVPKPPVLPRVPVIPERPKSPVNQAAELPPCKVQRNYCCSLCSYYTQNPRSHLLHQRDVHGIRLSIHSCQHCQYASRYFQKLKRHIKMVHTMGQTPEAATMDTTATNTKSIGGSHTSELKDAIVPALANERSENQTSTSVNQVPKPIPWPVALNPPRTPPKDAASSGNGNIKPTEMPNSSDKPSAVQKDPEAFFVAAYRNQIQKQFVHEQRVKQFVNAYREQQDVDDELKLPVPSPSNDIPTTSKAVKSSPLKVAPAVEVTQLLRATKDTEKERMFSCRKCNYVTHIKSRYNKHVKYHSMPMIQCDKCEFRTTYKWNLTRHLRSHRDNGIYKCSVCSFSAHMKQSLTSHEMNHHSPPIGCADGSAPIRRRRCRVGGSDLRQPHSRTENGKNEKNDALKTESTNESTKKSEADPDNSNLSAGEKQPKETMDNMDIDTSETESSFKKYGLTDSELDSSTDMEVDVDDYGDEATTSAVSGAIDHVEQPTENKTNPTNEKGGNQCNIYTDSTTDSLDSASIDDDSDKPLTIATLPCPAPPVNSFDQGSQFKMNSSTDNASECSFESSADKPLPNNFHVAYDSNSQSSSDSESSDDSSDSSTESSTESTDSSKVESLKNHRENTPLIFF